MELLNKIQNGSEEMSRKFNNVKWEHISKISWINGMTML